MWQSIQVWMTHGITICSEGIMVCGSMWEFILQGMKLRKSYLQDDGLRMVQYEWWPYNVADVYDFCIWSMRACEFINDE